MEKDGDDGGRGLPRSGGRNVDLHAIGMAAPDVGGRDRSVIDLRHGPLRDQIRSGGSNAFEIWPPLQCLFSTSCCNGEEAGP